MVYCNGCCGYSKCNGMDIAKEENCILCVFQDICDCNRNITKQGNVSWEDLARAKEEVE